jgi:hypothetical protein
VPRPGIIDVKVRELREGDIMFGTKEIVVQTIPPVKRLHPTKPTSTIKLFNPKGRRFRWAVWNPRTKVGILQRPAQDVTLRYDEEGYPIIEMATCGACGRRWNDAATSSVTPTPSGRCPFEYDHEEV